MRRRKSASENGGAPFVRRSGAVKLKDGAVLITGGAGFIGTNLAHRLLSDGQAVTLYDNLSRRGVEHNVDWLRSVHGDKVRLIQGDVRDADTLRRAVASASQVFHFAAQVAVTTSLENPIEDFEVNARGTLNLLEALRATKNPPPMLFTSTNKVYGSLADVPLSIQGGRYMPKDDHVRRFGFDEARPLHFHSPYGCSKGAACQYVQDYARTFGLKTAVFRMSCIYGPHQFGNEDQGWVAHFLIQALDGAGITLYGDGRQVRDVLFVEDLVEAMLIAQVNIDDISGRAFNIGGGPMNTVSLLELIELIGELHGKKPRVDFDEWRAADQQYYVSDTRAFEEATGWSPQVPVRAGVAKLYHWLQEFRRGIKMPIIKIDDLLPAGNARVGSGAETAKPSGNGVIAELKPVGRGRRALRATDSVEDGTVKLAKAG